MIPASLQQSLKALRMSALARVLEVRLQEARSNSLSHEQFLELVLQDELDTRDDRRVARRIKAAAFRDQRTLEDFDFSFNRSIKKNEIFDLAAGRFLDKHEDVLLIGPPGVGKSHLAQAIGHQLIRQGHTVLYRSIFDAVEQLRHDEDTARHERILSRYLKADLLIIDDMGIKMLPPKSGEYLFEIIMRRYELRSTMMASNRPLEEWGKLIGDVPAASAILDRFLHHAHLIKITGRSYRMQNRISK